jgi:uncharacterized protein YggT (Ycf19 family)
MTANTCKNMEAFILMFMQAVTAIIVLDAVLSWFQAPAAFPRSLTGSLTDPLYAPIRAVLKPQATGGIDFSPLIVLLLLQLLTNALRGLL